MIKKINFKKIIMLTLTTTMILEVSACKTSAQTIDEYDKVVVTEDENKTEDIVNTKVETNTTKSNVSTKKEKSSEEKVSEEEVVEYFENLETKIKKNLTKEKFNEVKDEVQEDIAIFILFLSGDKEIKGYTFSELSTEAKNKITNIFLSLDTKIESKIPGYKEKVSKTSSKAKTWIKSKYLVVKEKYDDFIKENVDQELLNETKESFSEAASDLKETTKDTAAKIKEKVLSWSKSKVQ